MKLYTPRNHVVVKIENQYYVVDTGSPVSFGFRGQRSLCIDGKTYALTTPLCDKGATDRLTGMDIAGLIGLDILSQTGFTIDYKNGEFLFSVAEETKPGSAYDEIKFRVGSPNELFSSMGRLASVILTEDLLVNRTKVPNVIVDTGACVPYLSGLTPLTETYEDESPIVGRIHGNYYAGDLATIGHPENPVCSGVKFGAMPPELELLNCGAIIGPAWFSNGSVTFDFTRGVIRCEKG